VAHGVIDTRARGEDDLPMEERRASGRQFTCIPAYFESRRDPQDLALIRDVSPTGARLYTRIRLAVDEELSLHLCLGQEDDPPRVAKGKVVRVDRRDPALSDVWSFDIGVVFEAPITEYTSEIEDLCARQEAAGVLKR
jgi:hypothetical protein